MQRTLLLSALFIGPVALTAQETVHISTNAQNSDQVFYQLASGTETVRPVAEWDLAFEISGITSTVRVNAAKGLRIFHVGPITDWDAVTTPDEDAWTEIHDSETAWSEGALSYGADEDGNMGWGTYNTLSHIISGTQMYAILMADGMTWKKLRIDGLVGGTYHFTYADLDGSNEQNATLAKSGFSGRNFGYWDLTQHTSVDREPASADWDLLFTKYMSDLGAMWYGVAGVLQNTGVQVAQLDGVDPLTVEAVAAEGQYSSAINIIGSDWKTLSGFSYVIVPDRAYFVKAKNGALWKLVFTDYSGSATGVMTFTQELVSAVGVDEIAGRNGQVGVYPNPASGVVDLLLDLPADQATVRIVDMGGQVVRTEPFTGTGMLTVRTIDLSGLPAGAYVVQATHAAGVATARLIVQ
jgi:hypothetical protein